MLFESIKKGDIELFIPQIVIDEVVNRFKKRLLKSKNTINSEVRTLKKLTDRDLAADSSIGSIEILTEEYAEFLHSIIEKAGVKTIDYPKTKHQFIAKRAIERLKPFNSNGKGYQDNLIWESIKSVLSEDEEGIEIPEVIFITDNSTDFCNSRENLDLHPDLENDLEEDAFNKKAVRILSNLPQYQEEHGKLYFAQAQNFKLKLEENEICDLNIEYEVGKYLLSDFIGYDLEDYDLDLPQEFMNPTVSSVNENVSLTITDAKKLNSKEYLVTIDFEVETEIDFYIDKYDYYGHYSEDNSVSLQEADWNDHVVMASTTTDIPITLSLIINTDLEISSFEVEKINKNFAQQRL